jgi:hypothetical protein
MKLSWSGRKQLGYALAAVGVVVMVAFILFIPRLQREPTCFDGKQNGSETGVDCGGQCPLYCVGEALPLVVSWSRALEVVPGRYNLVALVENQNTQASVYKIDYEFRLYDEDNLFITSRTGETFVNPNTKFAVFEPAVSTGNRDALRATFEFTSTPQWIRVPDDQVRKYSLSATIGQTEIEPGQSTISATVSNNSFFDLENVEVHAIVYDQQDNAIASSRTVLDRLPKRGSEDVVFTWPYRLPADRGRVDILPQVNILTVGY